MENEIVRRLLWAGLMAATAALATVVANRIAAAIWVRAFGEDPPE
jgi:F0F1-type ATP synthase membrane subunit c/vacuolar-type H+-ATPase subunit K